MRSSEWWVPGNVLTVQGKIDKLVLAVFCCVVSAACGYIAIVSLAHWATTGDMLHFRAFDPIRISVRPKIGSGSSLWADRIAKPGSYDWLSSLLAYLCMAAAALVIGWIGVVKGFGMRMAESFRPVVRACGIAGAVLFASLLLLRLGRYLFN